MKKVFSVVLLLTLVPVCARSDDVYSLSAAIARAKSDCAGISVRLATLKQMAGINTAITGVGTGLGVGATIAGFKKQKIDNLAKTSRAIKENALKQVTKNQVAGQSEENLDRNAAQFDELMAEKQAEKSKKLGDVRTGLMAGSTITNAAGTVIAAKNRVDDDLDAKIKRCGNSASALRSAITAAQVAGTDTNMIASAQQIVQKCEPYSTVDTKVINNRAMGAMISSATGGATGLVGTAVSAGANSDKVRAAGGQKEQNLNTASNALAITTSAASLTATVFNATQIAAIKKLANVADQCEEALK